MSTHMQWTGHAPWENGAMRPSRAPRVLRGSIAATVATFVAMMSHVAAGGTVPGWLGIAVPWTLSVAVCTMLVGRALSLVRLSLGVVVSQLLYHGLFVLGAVAPSGTPTTGHDHGHTIAVSTEALTVPLAADPAMWVSHALAAVVTVAALHRGERSLLRLRDVAALLLAWLRRSVRRIRIDLIPALRVELPRDVEVGFFAPLDPIAGVIRRRGPPALRVI